MSPSFTRKKCQVAGHFGLSYLAETLQTSLPRGRGHGGHQGTVDDAVGLLGTEEPQAKWQNVDG